MVKYIKDDVMVTFSEVPDEISLTLNISNCPHHCKGCHSPYLRKDIGDELTNDVLDDLIEKNEGVTCVCFLGEGNDVQEILDLAVHVHLKGLKTAIYCGTFDVDERMWDVFDYLKLGEYNEEKGPLNKETTNQRMYAYKTEWRADEIKNGIKNPQHMGWKDITYKFWKKI